MKRISLLLVAVLALVLAACGGDQAEATAEATVTVAPTIEPTEAATPTPTEEPTPSPDATDDDGSGATGELAEVLPDEVGGLQRTDMSGMEQMMLPMLEQHGIDPEDADFAFAMYGQGQLIVTGISMPGVDQPQLELIAQMMSGMQGVEGAEDLETETVTVGGKEVIRMTTAGQPQSVFMYIGQGTMFTVVAESEDLAAELLSQLP